MRVAALACLFTSLAHLVTIATSDISPNRSARQFMSPYLGYPYRYPTRPQENYNKFDNFKPWVPRRSQINPNFFPAMLNPFFSTGKYPLPTPSYTTYRVPIHPYEITTPSTFDNKPTTVKPILTALDDLTTPRPHTFNRPMSHHHPHRTTCRPHTFNPKPNRPLSPSNYNWYPQVKPTASYFPQRPSAVLHGSNKPKDEYVDSIYFAPDDDHYPEHRPPKPAATSRPEPDHVFNPAIHNPLQFNVGKYTTRRPAAQHHKPGHFHHETTTSKPQVYVENHHEILHTSQKPIGEIHHEVKPESHNSYHSQVENPHEILSLSQKPLGEIHHETHHEIKPDGHNSYHSQVGNHHDIHYTTQKPLHEIHHEVKPEGHNNYQAQVENHHEIHYTTQKPLHEITSTNKPEEIYEEQNIHYDTQTEIHHESTTNKPAEYLENHDGQGYFNLHLNLAQDLTTEQYHHVEPQVYQNPGEIVENIASLHESSTPQTIFGTLTLADLLSPNYGLEYTDVKPADYEILEPSNENDYDYVLGKNVDRISEDDSENSTEINKDSEKSLINTDTEDLSNNEETTAVLMIPEILREATVLEETPKQAETTSDGDDFYFDFNSSRNIQGQKLDEKVEAVNLEIEILAAELNSEEKKSEISEVDDEELGSLVDDLLAEISGGPSEMSTASSEMDYDRVITGISQYQ